MAIAIREFLAPVVDGITLDAKTTMMAGHTRIGLTDKCPNGEKPIRWLRRGARFAAMDNVLLGVSYDDLDECNLVHGKPLDFQIDGLEYQCRLLAVGSSAKQRNEWEEFFAGLGDNLTRSMDGCYSWGLDSPEGGLAAARRGCGMANWTRFSQEARLPLVGWRPVLEPILPPIDDIPAGFQLKVIGKDFMGLEVAVEGTLVYATDYDLFLRVDMFPDKRLHWWQAAGTAPGVITVDRAAIVRLAAL